MERIKTGVCEREKELEWKEVARREGSLCDHKRSPQIKDACY